MKLEIRQLRLKNFRSYGNYDTIVHLSNLGPVLILGEITDDEIIDSEINSSNGSGKSTLLDAIVWCLFGRLPSSRTPGDWVIHNIDEGPSEGCLVEITTIDGYIITRTRGLDGHSDLLIHEPDGTDISDSVNKNAQNHLNKTFSLDYEIFTSGVFFAQSGKPFLELSDQKRKKAMERLLSLTKFDTYATVAKEKLDASDTVLRQVLNESTTLDTEILHISTLIEEQQKKSEEWEGSRDLRIKAIIDKIPTIETEYDLKIKAIQNKTAGLERELNSVQPYDIAYITNKWENYRSEEKRLKEIYDNKQKLITEIGKLVSEKETLQVQDEKIDYSEQIIQLEKQISELQSEIDNWILHDIDTIDHEWVKYNERQVKITKINGDITILNQEIFKHETHLEIDKQTIKNWEDKKGTVCPECQQEIKEGHIHSISKTWQEKINIRNSQLNKIKKLLDSKQEELKVIDSAKPSWTIVDAKASNTDLEKKKQNLLSLQITLKGIKENETKSGIKDTNRQNRINEITKAISTKTAVAERKGKEYDRGVESNKVPEISISEAETKNQLYVSKEKEIQELKSRTTELGDEKIKRIKDIHTQAEVVKKELNPLDDSIKSLTEQLKTSKNNKTVLSKKVKQADNVVKHLTYIWRSYSDRRKIKSFVIGKLIPFFNERLAYYLNSLDCKFALMFNAALQIQTGRWPYELWSGGEKRRTDLAIMFAIHDLHESIYGKQCNLLVFDEYDRSLDMKGVHAFVNLLFKDFINSGLTILVISHNEKMKDMFPMKILVKKDADQSVVEEIR